MIFGGVFSELHDVRRAQGKRYALEPLLCAIVMSMLAGAGSLRTIEAFIDEQRANLNRLFGTSWRKAPSWVAIGDFLLGLDERELERVFREHAHRQASAPPGRQFIAIDGKALRGSADRLRDVAARQLVSAFDHDALIVLGHVDVEDKSNEIPAAQALIESFGLSGRVFTMDAPHCQKKRWHSRCRRKPTWWCRSRATSRHCSMPVQAWRVTMSPRNVTCNMTRDTDASKRVPCVPLTYRRTGCQLNGSHWSARSQG